MGLIKRTGAYGEYWGNTYDSSNALTYSQMELNVLYIYNYLSNEGWTLNAICGVLGNMQTESSINPGRWQNDSVGGDPSGHGYSLVQWTPYTNYTDWAFSEGYSDPSEMDTALDRIKYELANNLQWIPTSSYNYSFLQFTQSTDTPYNLALAFLANYERPAEPNQPIRGTQAEAWYIYLSGIVPELKKDKKFPWVLYARKLRERKYM